MPTEAQASIANGSKSFYLASLFFNRETRDASWHLYRWCRNVDDRIDLASDKDVALSRLAELRSATVMAFEENRELDGEFAGLRSICSRYEIPIQYPLELIKGLEMDVSGHRYEKLDEVELYSYYVAGVVGLMMCHITGVSDRVAHRNAIDLGVAMQLTNIARDVAEDFERGRVYLPATWLREAGVDAGELMSARQRPRVYAVVLRLLDRADELYRSGYAGLKYLPFRAALAVSIAGSIYSAIGRKIRAGGPEILDQRVYVGFLHKLGLVLQGTWRAFTRRFR